MTMSRLIGLAAFFLVSCVSHSHLTHEVVTHSEFRRTLHVDTDFNESGRADIRAAAADWRSLTDGRVQIDLVFDLDFKDMDGLREHKRNQDAAVIGLVEDMDVAKAIDQRMGQPGFRILGATFPDTEVAPLTVYIIADRIQADEFRAVITHEFGHVIGLPDLQELGSVMSKSSQPERLHPSKFTDADKALCRAHGYCL